MSPGAPGVAYNGREVILFSGNLAAGKKPFSEKLAPSTGPVLPASFSVMGYYILHNPDPRPEGVGAEPSNEPAALRARLENGSAVERRGAVLRLVELRAEDVLIACLASGQDVVVQLASAGLWECWLNEAGADARRRIEEGISQMNAGELEAAEETFQQLAAEFPDWAEAINKQATVLYLQGRPRDSIALCRRALALKPNHFGAWNGMALCAIQAEDWELAAQAVHESLRLQPRSQMNQQLLRLVETRLPQV